jgi:glucose dehydrogenase
MTLQEQSIADDKMRAEIAKLVAETSEINKNKKYRFWVMMAAYVSAMGILFKFF